MAMVRVMLRVNFAAFWWRSDCVAFPQFVEQLLVVVGLGLGLE